MTQSALDFTREQAARNEGMRMSANASGHVLRIAREMARQIAMTGDGTCDIERVRYQLGVAGVPFVPGNWMGSIFRTRSWQPTGRYVPACHSGGHNRMVREWRLTRLAA